MLVRKSYPMAINTIVEINGLLTLKYQCSITNGSQCSKSKHMPKPGR